ncbi:hypothetical protein PHYPSEUDO_004638 [Phytophthora pseudosyringae]|uniref:RxLR effector protein n=1 Tax=Phytophthora pseudosyringae TaxID=221518 RepID=A0A8T1VQZ7_9STRA|nr:hypothetical protein PHYPSEUDO_004638 [Phytophthora pseudosyringae]
MKSGVLAVLLFMSAIAIAAAQDPSTTGGQAGSLASDPNVPTTTQPATTAPPTTGASAGVGSATTGAPAPPAFAAPATQAPWAANPAPMTDGSGSGSFGSAGDIETPATTRPKRVTDSSRSQSSTPTPAEDSSAAITATTTGAWAVGGLALGLAAML